MSIAAPRRKMRARPIFGDHMPGNAPHAGLLARELACYARMRILSSLGRPVVMDSCGSGSRQPVVILPGFLSSDAATARLRRSLVQAGFDAHGWGLGRNRGVCADVIERLDERIRDIAGDRPVTLVGWSLGGLLAREYAKAFPDRVSRVVTLGSPFSGSLRANNAWRAYEMVAGHPVDAPPVSVTLTEKPPVQTIACWSPMDGVISPRSARGLPGERDEVREFSCSHMAYTSDAKAIRAIARLIAE